jgi:hypothetical protein
VTPKGSALKPQEASDHEHGLVFTLAVAALLAIAVLYVTVLPGFVEPTRPGRKEFFAAVAAVIPTLLIPLAIEGRMIFEAVAPLVVRDVLGVVALVANLGLMVAGEAAAISGLNCDTARCGDPDWVFWAVGGLVSGGALVLIGLMVSFSVSMQGRPLKWEGY